MLRGAAPIIAGVLVGLLLLAVDAGPAVTFIWAVAATAIATIVAYAYYKWKRLGRDGE